MQENKALRHVVLRCNNSVPLGVRIWTFFKRFILEKQHVRRQYRKELSETLFRAKIRRLLRRNGPIEARKNATCRGTSRRVERDILRVLYKYYKVLLCPKSPVCVGETKRGLGLFAQRDITALPRELFGAVAVLSDQDFSQLHVAEYPSLYGHGLLFGPVSLCNHECHCPFRFSNPISRGKPTLFEGFQIIRLKTRRKTLLVKKGDEICVNYGMGKSRKWFRCQCNRCMRSHSLENNVD